MKSTRTVETRTCTIAHTHTHPTPNMTSNFSFVGHPLFASASQAQQYQQHGGAAPAPGQQPTLNQQVGVFLSSVFKNFIVTLVVTCHLSPNGSRFMMTHATAREDLFEVKGRLVRALKAAKYYISLALGSGSLIMALTTSRHRLNVV